MFVFYVNGERYENTDVDFLTSIGLSKEKIDEIKADEQSNNQ